MWRFCTFDPRAETNEFLTANDPSRKIGTGPAPDPAYAAIVFPAPEQLAVIKWLFQQLTKAVESEFAFRNEMVFNYIQLLIFEGMKVTYKSMPDGRSIGLIVAGDVACNGVHLYVAETNAETRSSR